MVRVGLLFIFDLHELLVLLVDLSHLLLQQVHVHFLRAHKFLETHFIILVVLPLLLLLFFLLILLAFTWLLLIPGLPPLIPTCHLEGFRLLGWDLSQHLVDLSITLSVDVEGLEMGVVRVIEVLWLLHLIHPGDSLICRLAHLLIIIIIANCPMKDIIIGTWSPTQTSTATVPRTLSSSWNSFASTKPASNPCAADAYPSTVRSTSSSTLSITSRSYTTSKLTSSRRRQC